MKLVLSLTALAVLVASAAYLYASRGASAPTVNFRTHAIARGDLSLTVGATGTVEPEEVIDVGAQLVGRIKEIGKDPRGKTDPLFATKTIDYGSPVEEGMLLVQIDPSVYMAQRDQAEANLNRAKADLLQLRARFDQTEAEWKRAQKLQNLTLNSLSPTGSQSSRKPLQIKGITDADFVLAKANYEAAKANIEVGKSVIQQSTSALSLAETNLGYTTIKSPVAGTIIDRRVNIGQTVIASLNAPSLFLIAKDLRRMQVWASVNEADIGLLKVKMPVRFKVDAFPEDTFRGAVTQIRLNASMTQNVVTYTVVITTDNSNLKLLPYLTADVKFEVATRTGVLIVPNAALRYKPAENRIAPEYRESVPEARGEKQGVIWIRDNNVVRPVLVEIGITDGSSTEIAAEELQEGLEAVLGEKSQVATEEVTNPFGPPKIPGKKPGGAGKS